jgi:gamma-glutamylcyclotransferase (GGCT)/AIG2-like uncharacterized protein YtfP
MLLFVYGPYMNPKYLLERGVSISNARRAILKGYDLCFSTRTGDWKCAMIDLKEAKDKKVEGVLYEIDDSTMSIFDHHEKVGEGKHQRIEVDVETEGDPNIKAYTFICPKKEGDFIPSQEYLNVILEGARLNKLSKEYIESIPTHRSIGEKGP